MDVTYFYLAMDGVIHNKPISLYNKLLAVSRERDGATGVERLAIKLFDNDGKNTPYAVTYCSPLSLHDDIHRLRVYGFVAPCGEVMTMARKIEEKYHQLNCVIVEGARTLKDDFPGILRVICRYILDKPIEARTIGNNMLYNIDVASFKQMLKDSPYYCYRPTDVKRKLRDEGYTVCTPERFDNTIKTGGDDTAKVVSLIVEELADAMAEAMDELERDDE